MSSTSTKHDSAHFHSGEDIDDIITKYQIQDKRKTSVKKGSEFLKEVLMKDKDFITQKLRFASDETVEDQIFDLEKKLLASSKEAKNLRENLVDKENECGIKHIEKVLYRKMEVEMQARIDHLASENKRLNVLIERRLLEIEGRKEVEGKIESLEEKNKENADRVEIMEKEIKRLEKAVQDGERNGGEWKLKYGKLEGEVEMLKGELWEKDKEIIRLNKINKEHEDAGKEEKNLKEIIHRLEEENERLNGTVEEKAKDIEKFRIKLIEFEKKEVKTEYNKERIDTLVKDNEDLYKELAKRKIEIEDLERKLEELEKELAEAKELEKIVIRLNNEKELISVKYKEKKESYQKLKKVYHKLNNDLNEVTEKKNELEREIEELKRTISGYSKMIGALKNTVVKSEHKIHKASIDTEAKK